MQALFVRYAYYRSVGCKSPTGQYRGTISPPKSTFIIGSKLFAVNKVSYENIRKVPVAARIHCVAHNHLYEITAVT